MKQLVSSTLAFILLLFAATAAAVTWHPANAARVTWDPVTSTMDKDGNRMPLPAGDQITYRVYTKPPGTEQMLLVGEPDEPLQVITFDIEGRFLIGLMAVRWSMVNGTLQEVQTSDITWTDNPERLAPGVDPFGVQYFNPPSPPEGVKRE
jgi:hypothetical protein